MCRGNPGKACSLEEVEHVAWLARIELSEEEKALYTRQLNEILDYFRKLEELDLEDVPPELHVAGLVNVYREDECGQPLPREEALKNAPKKREG
ncbi:Asp-tRNA(Asn)/Glu-tRNA(Gln) amidotransferase GatCAB subunit C, partial [Candidatus Bathyarchaeota archaeon]